MAKLTQYYGTGRRKTSVARVYLRPGHGRITVKGRPVDTYFERESTKLVLRQPLALTETAQEFDIKIKKHGG